MYCLLFLVRLVMSLLHYDMSVQKLAEVVQQNGGKFAPTEGCFCFCFLRYFYGRDPAGRRFEGPLVVVVILLLLSLLP